MFTFSYNILGDKMKVMKMEEDDVVIFLPKSDISLDFSSKDHLEEYFKKLFLKLEEQYDMNMNGFYQIEVYEDSYYGVIFEIKMEDIPCFDYFDRQVEMSIHISKDTCFLYQIDDPFNFDEEMRSELSFYQYQNHFFVKREENLKKANYLKLLEHSNLIYGKLVNNILRFGKQIHFC